MLKVIFMGTPEFSVPTLSEIINAGHDVVAVYTQPPRPAGRGMEARKSPVHEFASSAGLKVLTPRSLRGAPEQQAFAAHDADVAAVVAYGLILPKAILEAPNHGCLNLHASALPRWRGAAPIQRAIMAGDVETAAMVMRMDEGLDTGPICLAEQLPIGPDMTAGELHDELSRAGAGLMVRALAALSRGTLSATEQSAVGVTYAAKIKKAEAKIDFSSSALDVHNLIRGLSPFPGAWFETNLKQDGKATGGGKTERVKVLRSELVTDKPAQATTGADVPGTILDDDLTIACGSGGGALRLITVQRAGKRPMSALEFSHGASLPAGRQLI